MTSVKGVVSEALPKQLFHVQCENGKTIIASIKGVLKRTVIKVIPGDRVAVQISSRDPSRGYIVAKQS